MKEVFQYKEFFKTSVKKEFRGKYKNSFLGVLWSFINPLLQMLVYSFVFSFITKADIPHFTSFLVIALIPWNFFNLSITQCAGCVIANAGILKKIYFPREILPMTIVTSNLLNFIISCLIIVAALLISGIGLSWYIIFVPLIVLIQYIFTLALGFIVSSLSTYIRDLMYFINIIMMLCFYLCPVVYSPDLIPANYRFIFELNPLLYIINGYRDCLYYQQMPNLQALGILALISVVLCFIGYKIFKKLEKNFVEEL